MRLNNIKAWAGLAALLTCEVALAQQAFLNLDERVGPEPQSTTRQFPIAVREATTAMFLDAKVSLSKGLLSLRLLDQAGKAIRDYGTGREFTVQGSVVPTREQGTFQLEVVTDGAVGSYKVQLTPLPPASVFRLNLVTGPAMILVALASVLYWRIHSKAIWRWFWVGAAAWVVGVGLKVAWAFLLNKPILHAVER